MSNTHLRKVSFKISGNKKDANQVLVTDKGDVKITIVAKKHPMLCEEQLSDVALVQVQDPNTKEIKHGVISLNLLDHFFKIVN